MNELFDKNIYIIEGFDMVGKTTFVNRVMSKFSLYEATHDLTDKTVGRCNSWVIGYGILDFLKQLPNLKELKVVINRGVNSAYTYQNLYKQGTGVKYPEIMKWYRHDEFFINEIGHLHFRHKTKDSARKIFESSQLRKENSNKLSSKYDKFPSFDKYWETYLKAEKYFEESYRLSGIENKVIYVDVDIDHYTVNFPDSRQEDLYVIKDDLYIKDKK